MEKKYVSFMLLPAYRAAELFVNMLKDNFGKESKEMALMIKRTENNCTSTYSQYRSIQSQYLVEIMHILPSWSSFERPLCSCTLFYRLLMLSYATLTPKRWPKIV